MTADTAKATRTRDRVQAESKLIAAATEIFSEFGYDGATTRMIAERAGINLALITRYFKNKHGLLLAVMEQGSTDMHAIPLPYPPQKTVLGECLCFVEAHFKLMVSNTQLFKIVIVQGLTDREFLHELRQRDFERPRQISNRLLKLLKPKSTQREVEKIVDALDRLIFGTVVGSYFLRGDDQEQCIADLQSSVRALMMAAD